MIRAESHLLSQVNSFLVTFYFVRCRTQFLSLEISVIINLLFVSSVITSHLFSSSLLKLGMRSLSFQQCVSPLEFLLITLLWNVPLAWSPQTSLCGACDLWWHCASAGGSDGALVHSVQPCGKDIYFCYNLFSRTFILPQCHPVVVT